MNLFNSVRTLMLLLLVLLPTSLLAGYSNIPVTHALENSVTVEVWNPDLHSSNITSLTQFPIGSTLAARVNVSNAGPINGFDVSVSYNITAGPNVLQALNTGTELVGGLFDPGNSFPAGCGVLVAKDEIDIPAGHIRLAAVTTGGCSVNGTGTLFTVVFQVTGIGATAIDIVRTNSFGKVVSSIIGPSPTFAMVPFQPIDAYFRNKPGIPPVAFFNNTPANPILNDTVNFDASQSYDPDNSTLVGQGIKRFFWNFGDVSFDLTAEEVKTSHVFTYLSSPTSGSFTVRLVVWDSDDQLPAEKILVVNVAPGLRTLSSFNWSGYAVEGAAGSVTDVKGSWMIPAIVGGCPATDTHSSFWVGIDGLKSPTVEQVGTESACINGTPSYFAWYEFFPRPALRINTITLRPGDVVSAEVQFSNNKFIVSLTDVSTGGSFSRSLPINGAARSSAEWIAEAPSSRTGQLPLANFGTVTFGQDNTAVAGTCSAVVGPTSGPIGTFGSSVVVISMVTPILPLASPTSLSKDGTSFSVIWKHA